MSKQNGFVEAIIMIVVIGLIIVGAFWLISSADANGNAQTGTATAEPQAQEEKPLTKTRCDWTGWASSSIIEEESANGYRFTGRYVGPFCENNLAFELREGQQ